MKSGEAQVKSNTSQVSKPVISYFNEIKNILIKCIQFNLPAFRPVRVDTDFLFGWTELYLGTYKLGVATFSHISVCSTQYWVKGSLRCEWVFKSFVILP